MNPSADSCCIVCYEAMDDKTKAIIKGCAHAFCFVCITSWAQTNSSCPLCKQEFTVLQHTFVEDGSCTEETVGAPVATAVSVEEQLNCLDHSFFIAEVNKLLQGAERVHKQLWLDGRSGRGLSVIEKEHLSVIENVCYELRNHKRKLQALLHFEPHQLLQDLYRLQGMMDDVWMHNNPYGAHSPAQAAASAPTRYSADDAWEGDISDDDADFVDDFGYLAISKGKQPKINSNVTINMNSKPKKSKSKSKSKSKQTTPLKFGIEK